MPCFWSRTNFIHVFRSDKIKLKSGLFIFVSFFVSHFFSCVNAACLFGFRLFYFFISVLNYTPQALCMNCSRCMLDGKDLICIEAIQIQTSFFLLSCWMGPWKRMLITSPKSMWYFVFCLLFLAAVWIIVRTAVTCRVFSNGTSEVFGLKRVVSPKLGHILNK